MNTCKYCFTAIPDDAAFCPGCGAERNDALNRPQRASAQGQAAPEQPVYETPVYEQTGQPVPPADTGMRDTNGFSIAAFICAFFVPVAGIVLSIIAMVQANSNAYVRPLKGLAIWALVLSILNIIFRIALLCLLFALFSGFFSNLYNYINGILNSAIPTIFS